MKKKSNKKFLKALGKRVKEIRKQNKISQDQLSFEVGIRREQIVRIEAGTQNSGIDILRKIAEIFEMKLKDLLDFEY